MRCAIVILFVIATGCRTERATESKHALPAGDPAAGQAVFVRMQCWACHEIYGGGVPAPIARPPVPAYLGGNQIEAPDDRYLVASIVDPSHELAPGWPKELMTTTGGASRMATYADALTARELFDLIAFLKSRYQKQSA